MATKRKTSSNQPRRAPQGKNPEVAPPTPEREQSRREAWEKTCVCGHSMDDHGGNGSCRADDCECGGFEELDDEDLL